MATGRSSDYDGIQAMIDDGAIPSRAAYRAYASDRGNIPNTPEQKERLGRIRMKRLRIIKITSIITLVTSLPSIVVGVLIIMKTSTFPYILGGGIISGAGCILMSLCSFCLVYEGQKEPTGDMPTPCTTNLVKGHVICTTFLSMGLMISLGMSGIWATIECFRRRPDNTYKYEQLNSCEPNPELLKMLSVMTLVLVSALFIMTLVICASYCITRRAFGIRSNYEWYLYNLRKEQEQNQEVSPMEPGDNFSQGQQHWDERRSRPPDLDFPHPSQSYQPESHGQGYPPRFQGEGYQPQSQGQGHLPRSQDRSPRFNEQRDPYRHVPQDRGQYNTPTPSAPPLENDVIDDTAPPPSYEEVTEGKYSKL